MQRHHRYNGQITDRNRPDRTRKERKPMKRKKFSVITLINRILPNVCIILACMILTFLVINIFNTAMQFMTNDITTVLLFVLMGVSIWVSLLAIYYQRKLYAARQIMRKMQNYINKIDAENDGGSGDGDRE